MIEKCYYNLIILNTLFCFAITHGHGSNINSFICIWFFDLVHILIAKQNCFIYVDDVKLLSTVSSVRDMLNLQRYL